MPPPHLLHLRLHQLRLLRCRSVHSLPVAQHVSCSHFQVRCAEVDDDAPAILLAAQQHGCDALSY